MVKLFNFNIIIIVIIIENSYCDRPKPDIRTLVEKWSRTIGKELYNLSLAMSRKNVAAKHFLPLQKNVEKADGAVLIQDVASEIRKLMDKKVEAVQRIADYAEFLAYNRNMTARDESFQFSNAENITDITPSYDKEIEVQEYVRDNECIWWCYQNASSTLPYNNFTRAKIAELFVGKREADIYGKECDCHNLPNNTKPLEWFNHLPMTYDAHLTEFVNYNLSNVKVVANVYHRDPWVMLGIHWTEALDLVFKDNLHKDPTLTYQFFASPLGYMRHYPAVVWGSDQYVVTYDPRTRSWYTEAMTSPKDIFILVDISGSMKSQNHRKISRQIINNILDTLNDNDFVNIYTFTNVTEPLVACFNNTLVQANEENLRLLRESLDVYSLLGVVNMTTVLKKAFNVLQTFRDNQFGSQCNQAIMLITDTLDDEVRKEIFDNNNWQKGTPVRIFTYLLGINEDDSNFMEWIACSNRGYFVNITLESEVREKVLNYMNVMSRPINSEYTRKQEAIWSYLQIDLADRRYSNWLWKKFERNRQRQVFLDHVKRKYLREKQFLTSGSHMLLQENVEKYQQSEEYNYLTTVSMPVYGRRMDTTHAINHSRYMNDFDLIGVAAVDVPVKLLYSLVPHYKIGVNGYAFILTNNGYILMHPGHRREGIPKPTFNRVDLLEIEILDDTTEPRLFDDEILKLREKIVNRRSEGYVDLKVKFPLDNMKRVMLSERRYYNTVIGPFNLGIALHHQYGLMVVNSTQVDCEDIIEVKQHLMATSSANWTVHPFWVYCKNPEGNTPEKRVLNCIDRAMRNCGRKSISLLKSLIFDMNATKWFPNNIPGEHNYRSKHLVTNVFLATYSGLTRWKNFENEDLLTKNRVNEDMETFDDGDNFETNMNFTAIDEDWYIRTVEENYKDEEMFIYSVPFEISGYENNTLITSTNAIFVKDKHKEKFPAAVVGLQFNHRAMYELYNNITAQCYSPGCELTCQSDFLTCFILDNNAYVILADEVEYTGRFIGNIKPDIMFHLVKNGVYKPTRMFDYQAICQKEPPKSKEESNNGIRIGKFLDNIVAFFHWALITALYLIRTVASGPDYQSDKEDTLAFERLEIQKTFPTPCDTNMWLFNLGTSFSRMSWTNKTSKFDCAWMYVVEKIPNSNLLFMAINNLCVVDTVNTYHNSPTPVEILYEGPPGKDDKDAEKRALPCYIATHNQFSRRIYMNCYNNSVMEETLIDGDRYYCGRTWPMKNSISCVIQINLSVITCVSIAISFWRMPICQL